MTRHSPKCLGVVPDTENILACTGQCLLIDWGSGVSKCQLCSGFITDAACDCSTPSGICRRIKYKSLLIEVRPESNCKPALQYLQVTGVTGGRRWAGRKWRLSEHMTKGEIIQTAFMACMAWEEHECREAFKYKGCAVFGPHFNVESLVRLCEQGQFEERPAQQGQERA